MHVDRALGDRQAWPPAHHGRGGSISYCRPLSESCVLGGHQVFDCRNSSGRRPPQPSPPSGAPSSLREKHAGVPSAAQPQGNSRAGSPRTMVGDGDIRHLGRSRRRSNTRLRGPRQPLPASLLPSRPINWPHRAPWLSRSARPWAGRAGGRGRPPALDHQQQHLAPDGRLWRRTGAVDAPGRPKDRADVNSGPRPGCASSGELIRQALGWSSRF